MNIVFMGTPDFAVPALEALAADTSGQFTVKLVLTRPDSVSGRGKTRLPSPVRLCAQRHGIEVLTPRSLRASEASAAIHSCEGQQDAVVGGQQQWIAAPAVLARNDRDVSCIVKGVAALRPDFIVVAAYGLILPKELLELPRFGCINIHASLLPRWRGAAPIQRAILAGDQQAGISIMRMEEGLDTGAVCATGRVATDGKNLEALSAELALLGSELLLAALPQIASGSAVWQKQDDSQACYAEKIDKGELALSPGLSAEMNLRRVLASSPQAPARCLIAGRSVTLLDARIVTDPNPDVGAAAAASTVATAAAAAAAAAASTAAAAASTAATAAAAEDIQHPGHCEPSPDGAAIHPSGSSAPAPASFSNKRLLLATASGQLEVLSMKPDGKREMTATAFASGVPELGKSAACPASWSAVDAGMA